MIRIRVGDVAGSGQQFTAAATPVVYYRTDSSDRWRFAGLVFAGLVIVPMLLLSGRWLVITAVQNQNYWFCSTNDLCYEIARAEVQADVHMKMAPHAPIVVLPPPAPPAVVIPAAPQQQVIMQPQAPQTIVAPPAPQPNVVYDPRRPPCCGTYQALPPQQMYGGCNPTGGGYSMGNPCQPYGYGYGYRRRFMGMGGMGMLPFYR